MCTDVAGNEQLRRHHNKAIEAFKCGNLLTTGEGKNLAGTYRSTKGGKNGKDDASPAMFWL